MKKITEITKRDIIDLLINGKEEIIERYFLPLYGKLDELSFLKRLYNLSSLPSNDPRFKDAEGDIIQHTINNDDWYPGWIFYDDRFELQYGDDKIFLRFICENFHPAVRKERGPWREFLNDINTLLLQDGYELYECNTISGRSVYDFKEITMQKKSQRLKKGTALQGIFDNYTISKQFDQGGSARLFEVTDSNNNVHALKAIVSDEKTLTEKIKRFKNELIFSFKQENDNVVKVTDFNVTKDQNVLFYIMPKYDCSLRKLINDGIPESKIIKYFWQICEGIKSAHNRKCWHRDLKPENILYDKTTDTLVVADFGIAHFQDSDKSTKIKTKETDKLANFDYHAPEQRKGNIVDSPSPDIWALGLILNEMFTHELAQGVDFKKISSVNATYAGLDDLVNKMLKAQPEERCQNMSEVEMLFVACLGDKNTEFYPELVPGSMNFLVYPQKGELEDFVSNDETRRNIIKGIENLINLHLEDEIYPLYISFLTQVIKYINATRDNFNEYNAIIKVILDVIKDENLINRPNMFLVFIAEKFNRVSDKIGTKQSEKRLGLAWDATKTWLSQYKCIPADNLQAILNTADINYFTNLKWLIKHTLDK